MHVGPLFVVLLKLHRYSYTFKREGRIDFFQLNRKLIMRNQEFIDLLSIYLNMQNLSFELV